MLTAIPLLIAVMFILGILVGVVLTAEVMHHFVRNEGSFRFDWRGKKLCVKGSRR